MVSSGMLRHVVLVRTDVSEELSASFIRVTKIGELVLLEVLYNILIEFGITMKLVRLIKMCLNETYSKVRISKHLSDSSLAD
jgi:hypothetical protein